MGPPTKVFNIFAIGILYSCCHSALYSPNSHSVFIHSTISLHSEYCRILPPPKSSSPSIKFITHGMKVGNWEVVALQHMPLCLNTQTLLSPGLLVTVLISMFTWSYVCRWIILINVQAQLFSVTPAVCCCVYLNIRKQSRLRTETIGEETDNTMAKRKGTKGQTTIHKTYT